MQAFWLGRAAYGPVLVLQERLWHRAQASGQEALLLCEHEPVITLGHGALPGDLCASPAVLHAESVATFAVRRGGRATYHGPGQLVAYPIVSVRRGVLFHVLALGAAACELAQSQGIPAAFQRDPVGVFVADRKLAAIGVQVRRRVSTHGLALNVTAEACRGARAGLLVPCGEPTRALTSLAEEVSMNRAVNRGGMEARRAPTDEGGREGPPLIEEGGRAGVEELVTPLCRALCRALGRPEVAPEATTTDSLLLALPAVK